MNTKHMPGHWEFDAQDTYFAFCGADKRPAANPDYDLRIEFSDHVPEDEVGATVHLIRAAPDLYEALEAILEEYAGISDEWSVRGRRAIAKARGETKTV